MRLRTTLASALAASAIGLSALITAPAANAASTTPSDLYYPNVTGCGTLGSNLYTGAGQSGSVFVRNTDVVTGTTGDTIRIHNECSSTIWINPGGASFPLTLSIATGSDLLVTLAGTPGTNIIIQRGNGSLDATLAVLPTSGTAPGPSPSPTPSSDASDSSTPAPVVQQFGMPATGTCDEAQPEGLNWSGVASGGWGVSWAQWVNDGNGGAVCTRTLVYSTAQSKWIIN